MNFHSSQTPPSSFIPKSFRLMHASGRQVIYIKSLPNNERQFLMEKRCWMKLGNLVRAAYINHMIGELFMKSLLEGVRLKPNYRSLYHELRRRYKFTRSECCSFIRTAITLEVEAMVEGTTVMPSPPSNGNANHN